MTILVSLYWKNTNDRVMVLQEYQQIKEIYGRDVNNVDEIYAKLKEKNPEEPPVEPSESEDETITLTASDIGKYVDYLPDSNIYKVEMINTEYTSDQEFTTENLQWRVWSIDSDVLTLISDKPTQTQLFLFGYQGYNNGVYLLNQICKNNYNNIEYSGLTARSIKMEDIENVTNISYNTYEGYGQCTKYSDIKVPKVWEELDKQREIENRSKQEELYSGLLEDTTEIELMGTDWIHEYSYENIQDEWKKEIYYDLILNVGEWYGVATRSMHRTVENSLDYVTYCIGAVYNNQKDGKKIIYGPGLANTKNDQTTVGFNLRPMIEIPLSSCKITLGNDANHYHIEAKKD